MLMDDSVKPRLSAFHTNLTYGLHRSMTMYLLDESVTRYVPFNKNLNEYGLHGFKFQSKSISRRRGGI